MLTPITTDAFELRDLSHEARRFRTILSSFESTMDVLFKNSKFSAKLDHVALAEAFTRWRAAFDKSKYLATKDRRDFVIFAAGTMLKELIAAAPLKATQGAGEPVPTLPLDIDHQLKRWPEGYAYTVFCLSVASAILREMGEAEPVVTTKTEETAFWDSFRENTLESPHLAVAFFDVVCGQQPNWDAPGVPWLRHAYENQKKLS